MQYTPVVSRLGEIRVHIIARGDGQPSAPELTLTVPLDGRAFVVTPNDPFLPGFFRIRYHPFQKLFHEEYPPLFRPSWEPSGRRLVVSDGLRLLLWELGSGDAAPIPGTEDAVSPAWSPDGAWIAFTQLVRGDPVAAGCTHFGLLGPVCRQERVDFPIRRREIVLIRPDGSQIRSLGPGEEPAWTPSGTHLVVRRDGRLWVVGLNGGDPVPIEGTEGAREPQVSPDGRALAYVRSQRGGKHDLWVRPFAEGGA